VKSISDDLTGGLSAAEMIELGAAAMFENDQDIAGTFKRWNSASTREQETYHRRAEACLVAMKMIAA
jgi:hypothetical protein